MRKGRRHAVTGLEQVAVFGAGVAAGAINTIVGSGSLITFPTLLAFGYPPVVANVSNTVGLVPGSVSGAWGYRRELAGQGRRLIRLGVASGLGGLSGALLLLVLPASAFKAIVPALIILACLLVILQPAITRRMEERGRKAPPADGGLLLLAGLFGAGVYGGYFGAAQGVLLLGLLGFADEALPRLGQPPGGIVDCLPVGALMRFRTFSCAITCAPSVALAPRSNATLPPEIVEPALRIVSLPPT